MKDLTKTGSKINSKMGKAISDYDLIRSGDRILVAVSGGKDSLTLLSLLKKIQSWAPVKFSLYAAHITTDLDGENCVQAKTLEKHFQDIGVEYFFSHVDILNEKGKTSCFWCSWNKRKALFEVAERNFCNKLAFGHHKDDIVETVLLNILFKGEISAINPRQELFDGKLTLIRPLCYVEERLTKIYAKEKGFSSQTCSCQFAQKSKRKVVKDILSDIEKKTPGTNIKTNVFNSITRIRKDYINLKEEGSSHNAAELLETEH